MIERLKIQKGKSLSVFELFISFGCSWKSLEESLSHRNLLFCYFQESLVWFICRESYSNSANCRDLWDSMMINCNVLSHFLAFPTFIGPLYYFVFVNMTRLDLRHICWILFFFFCYFVEIIKILSFSISQRWLISILTFHGLHAVYIIVTDIRFISIYSLCCIDFSWNYSAYVFHRKECLFCASHWASICGWRFFLELGLWSFLSI